MGRRYSVGRRRAIGIFAAGRRPDAAARSLRWPSTDGTAGAGEASQARPLALSARARARAEAGDPPASAQVGEVALADSRGAVTPMERQPSRGRDRRRIWRYSDADTRPRHAVDGRRGRTDVMPLALRGQRLHVRGCGVAALETAKLDGALRLSGFESPLGAAFERGGRRSPDHAAIAAWRRLRQSGIAHRRGWPASAPARRACWSRTSLADDIPQPARLGCSRQRACPKASAVRAGAPRRRSAAQSTGSNSCRRRLAPTAASAPPASDHVRARAGRRRRRPTTARSAAATRDRDVRLRGAAPAAGALSQRPPSLTSSASGARSAHVAYRDRRARSDLRSTEAGPTERRRPQRSTSAASIPAVHALCWMP